jgi:hypothetical protein
VRCDNQHFVPSGFSYCRQCEKPTSAVMTAVPPTAEPVARANLMTVGEYLDERDRLLVMDTAVVAACLFVATGSSPAALLPAAVGAIVALLFARLLVGVRKTSDRARDVASAVQARMLDRLVVVPVIAVAVTAVAALVRW